MLSIKRGDEASPGLGEWANRIAKSVDAAVEVEVYFDADSNTFVLRLVKGPRVLIFRLSQSQVHTDGRESECERTLQRKIKDLWNCLATHKSCVAKLGIAAQFLLRGSLQRPPLSPTPPDRIVHHLSPRRHCSRLLDTHRQFLDHQIQSWVSGGFNSAP
jgi:hypothetical protein